MFRDYLIRVSTITSFLTFCTFSLSSQNIIEKIEPSISMLMDAQNYVETAEYYDINISTLKSTLNNPGSIEIDIPIGRRSKTLVLEKFNILTPDYRLHTSSGQSYSTANKYVFYKGHVEGYPTSKAILMYHDDEVAINIFDEDGNFEINPLDDIYAGYYNHDHKNPGDPDWGCEVIDESGVRDSKTIKDSRSNNGPECVTVFLEIDHNMYNKKGSDVANTESWALNLMSQVAILFIEHNVPLNVSGIQVWDTPDPYLPATNTSGALNIFRSLVHDNPNNNGRLAHLLSGRGLGGGIAYLNSLCSTFTNVAVSANLSGGSTPYPTYSWNVMVVAHELGHNMGSPHTQNCSWNGNNTAIDGCGNIEGSCADPGNPPGGGTIMSYCHLTSSGINFSKGFGPQPGGLIEEKYIYATCETGDNCSYVAPFNDVCARSKELPILNYCVKGYFENYATTPSGDGGSMSCGQTGTENDIWFEFEYINVDTVKIEVEATDQITDLVVELYTGNCNALSTLDCGFSLSGEKVEFSLHDPALVNETIYVRVVEKDSDEEGEFSICIYSSELPCQSQLDTLLNIYSDLSGSTWTNNSGWQEGDLNGACDYCNWYGITCNYLGEVVEIDLSGNNLQGMLPQDLIALSNLKRLILNNNLLIDTIPNYWDSLDQMIVLDLSYNNLTGSIPLSYTTMNKINTVHLDYNQLGNLIPPGLGYNFSLRTFTASNNLLEGCFSAGVSNLCSKDSLNFSNNPDLPYGGDVTLLCEEGWGTDWDNDTYCNEIEDCNDFDENINPGMDEVLCDALDNNCDGTIDEGSDFGPNIWIGPDTLGVFDDSLNWSLGHIPKICENIEIGLEGDTIDLILLGNTSGGTGGNGAGTSYSLQIRDLNIGPNTTLHLGESFSLSILGNGVIMNDGTFNIEGYINIRDQTDTNNTALLNGGNLNIIGYGGISINEIGDYAIDNKSTGVIEMSGFSSVDAYNSENAKSAILNEGIFNILGNLYIYGPFMEDAVKNSNGGQMEVKNGGLLRIQ